MTDEVKKQVSFKEFYNTAYREDPHCRGYCRVGIDRRECDYPAMVERTRFSDRACRSRSGGPPTIRPRSNCGGHETDPKRLPVMVVHSRKSPDGSTDTYLSRVHPRKGRIDV